MPGKKIYKGRGDAGKWRIQANKSLSDITTDIKADDRYAHITDWKELARYNWGTERSNELNRVFYEEIGCGAIDKANAENTKLDPAADTDILVPQLYTGEAIQISKKTTFKVKSPYPRPVPAVNIQSLDRWFQPGGPCTIKYELEGATARADKLDFEVHTSRYFEENKGGELIDSSTDKKDASATHIYKAASIYEEKNPETKTEPPSDPQSYNEWKGESQATKGILKSTSKNPANINHTSR